MAAAEQGPNGNGAHGQAPPPETAPPPPPLDIVKVLGEATVCAELTPADVQAAMRRGMDAPVHLGAIVAAHCTETPDDPQTSQRVNTMKTRLAEHKNELARTRGRAARERVRTAAPPEPSKEETTAADRYTHLVGEARRHNDAFAAQYQPDGRLDTAAVATLYDATDELEHPAIEVLEAAVSRTTDNTVRTALIAANRLVRHIVHQAVLSPGTPAQSQ